MGAKGLSHADSDCWEGLESCPVQNPDKKASADQPLGLGYLSVTSGSPVDLPHLS